MPEKVKKAEKAAAKAEWNISQLPANHRAEVDKYVKRVLGKKIAEMETLKLSHKHALEQMNAKWEKVKSNVKPTSLVQSFKRGRYSHVTISRGTAPKVDGLSGDTMEIEDVFPWYLVLVNSVSTDAPLNCRGKICFFNPALAGPARYSLILTPNILTFGQKLPLEMSIYCKYAVEHFKIMEEYGQGANTSGTQGNICLAMFRDPAYPAATGNWCTFAAGAAGMYQGYPFNTLNGVQGCWSGAFYQPERMITQEVRNKSPDIKFNYQSNVSQVTFGTAANLTGAGTPVITNDVIQALRQSAVCALAVTQQGMSPVDTTGVTAASDLFVGSLIYRARVHCYDQSMVSAQTIIGMHLQCIDQIKQAAVADKWESEQRRKVQSVGSVTLTGPDNKYQATVDSTGALKTTFGGGADVVLGKVSLISSSAQGSRDYKVTTDPAGYDTVTCAPAVAAGVYHNPVFGQAKWANNTSVVSGDSNSQGYVRSVAGTSKHSEGSNVQWLENTSMVLNGTAGNVPIVVTGAERLSGGNRCAETDKATEVMTWTGSAYDHSGLYTKAVTIATPYTTNPGQAGYAGIGGFNGSSNVGASNSALIVCSNGTAQNWLTTQGFDAASGNYGMKVLAGSGSPVVGATLAQETSGKLSTKVYGNNGGSEQAVAVNSGGSMAANITAVDSAVSIISKIASKAGDPTGTIPVYLTGPAGTTTVNVTDGCIEIGLRGSTDGKDVKGPIAKVESTGSLDTKVNATGGFSISQPEPIQTDQKNKMKEQRLASIPEDLDITGTDPAKLRTFIETNKNSNDPATKKMVDGYVVAINRMAESLKQSGVVSPSAAAATAKDASWFSSFFGKIG